MKFLHRCFQKRRLFRILGFCVVVWLFVILYTYTTLDIAMENVWNGILRRNLDQAKLQELMATQDPGHHVVHNALADIILPQEDILNFFHLPKRSYDTSYTEITSANRDTASPIAPDFTFHIAYSETDVTLYEDYGPGCIYRIYLFPDLPTETEKLHKVKASDLKDSFLMLNIDGRQYWFSLQQLMDANQWPFLYPVNTRHGQPSSGMGAYTPFCYQNSMTIQYHPQNRLPPNLFLQTVNCSLNGFLCPVHVYSAVSRHKYPAGTPVNSFTDDISTIRVDHKKATENAALMLNKPEIHGPDSGDTCVLKCVEVCNGCRRMLFKTDQPGVITSLKIRIYDTNDGILLHDWTQILITFQFDNMINPQIDRIPLGSLFGVSGSLNNLKGAAVGHMPRKCAHTDTAFDLPKYDMTGYLYFAMPYWQSGVVYVEGAENLDTSQLLCFQFTTVENYYEEFTTGYFHVDKTYYTEKADGVRKILSLQQTWGSIVGLFMEVDNLYANRRVPVAQRWGLLQADHVLYIDGSPGASMLGTGLEDYFSYAHGFNLAENTSYAFVGVHHSAPRRAEPLTWHCYRLHILDPIYFHDSIDFIMEGNEHKNFSPEQQLTYEEHWSRKTTGQSGLSHMVMYYAKGHTGLLLSDTLHLANTDSESKHNYRLSKGQRMSGKEFTVSQKRYLGQLLKDEIYTKKGRTFAPAAVFQFTLDVKNTNNKGAILRREFYSVKKEWNEKALIRINGQEMGHWFIPMGTLSDEYVLRTDDFPVYINITSGGKRLNIEIEPITKWRDVAYHLYLII